MRTAETLVWVRVIDRWKWENSRESGRALVLVKDPYEHRLDIEEQQRRNLMTERECRRVASTVMEGWRLGLRRVAERLFEHLPPMVRYDRLGQFEADHAPTLRDVRDFLVGEYEADYMVATIVASQFVLSELQYMSWRYAPHHDEPTREQYAEIRAELLHRRWL